MKKVILFLVLILLILQSTLFVFGAVSGEGSGKFNPDNFDKGSLKIVNKEDAPKFIEDNTKLVLGESFSGVAERPGGGAFIDSVDSLTTPDGRIFQNVRGAELDSNGNIIRADSLEFQGGIFTNVKDFKITDTGYTIGSADKVIQDGNLITNGQGIKYENGILTAEHADSFIKAGSISTNIDNLESYPDRFFIEKADSVLSGCVNIENIEDSTFTIYGNAVEVEAGKGVVVNINDCSGNKVKFESNNGRVIVSKDIPTNYYIEGGSLTYENEDFKERIDANNSARVELDPNYGFSCMRIMPIGTYWYNAPELIKDFGINIPEIASEYKLCLRKNDAQQYSEYDGLVDFPDKKIELKKVVNYLRPPFDENRQLKSLLMGFVYQGMDENNKALLNLDDDFIFVNKFSIENEFPDVFGMISYINNGNYAIYELSNGFSVKRFGRFNYEIKPAVIRKYNSNFGNDNPEITFQEGIMVQEGTNDFGTETKVKTVCNDCLQQKEFEQEMLERSRFYSIEKGMCGI